MGTRIRLVAALALIVSMFSATIGAAAQDNGNDNGNDTNGNGDPPFEIHGYDFHAPEFHNVWERTDRPVLEGDVARSWLWGPAANTPLIQEEYAEADDEMRGVQYSDKSRMEMRVAASAAAADDEESPWNITQGLLATELMTGNLQLGDDTFEQHEPADIPVAGDGENNPGPTYADMATYMDWDARGADRLITQYLDEDGAVDDDDRFGEYGVYDRYYIEQTDHNIASVFWEFMQSEGLVYDNGQLTEGPLFLNEFYAIGFPTTEAYWGEFRLRGEVQDILVQCFERRCLTYAPNNPEEWQVESGNVGLHYFNWRYNIIGEPVTPPELSLVLAQDEDENEFGTNHTFTATLAENGDPVTFAEADVSVTVERDGAALDPIDGLDVDVENDVATITYAGPATGTVNVVDTINVAVDVDGTTVHGEPALTKTWVFAPETCDVTVGDDDSIQAAIDGADPGDFICVEGGTYSENIDINVDGLTLIALEGPDETAIQSDTTAEGGVVAISADDVTISGFTVDNQNAEGSRAIRFADSVDGVTIENNVLTNALRGVQGNWTDGGENINIVGNTFNVAYGVAGTENVDGLVIAGNTFNTTEEGVGLGEGVATWFLETNHFAGSGNHVVDYRDTPVPAELTAIIDANTFENEVEVVGNAIVDVDDD